MLIGDWGLGGLGGEAKGRGRIYIEPLFWSSTTPDNEAVVNIEDLSLKALLETMEIDGLDATGQVFARLPIRINGPVLTFEEGRLHIKEGGLIAFKNKTSVAAAEAHPSANYAFRALEHFEYSRLEGVLNGPIGGAMRIEVDFSGNNPDFIGGAPFEFSVGIEGELGSIMRNTKQSLSVAQTLKSLTVKENIPHKE